MPDLEAKIVAWRIRMASAGISALVLDELEDHLREDVARRVRSGIEMSQAFDASVEQIGCANSLKDGEIATLSLSKILRRIAVVASAAFIVGALVSHAVLFPWAIDASRRYAVAIGIEPNWSAQAEIIFALKLVFGVGLAFGAVGCLPGLIRARILDSRRLVRFRVYAVVLNLLFAALLTTPEVLTQLLMFVPLQLLYEATIWTARFVERRARKVAQ